MPSTASPAPLETAVISPASRISLSGLDPLPYPVFFVTKDPKWRALIDDASLAADESWYAQVSTSEDIWSAQVFLDLWRCGLDVHLVPAAVPGKICVIPCKAFQRRDHLYLSYVVACHTDGPNPVYSQQQTVLNPMMARARTQHPLMHRPQPLLQPRPAARGTRLENLVFKGHSYNLFEPFRSPSFLSALADLGVQLKLSTEGCADPFADWADYTEADAVLAIRNATLYDVGKKPALKLINAWAAGCPALLGPEPAYQLIRRSELDYLEVRTPADALAAVRRLKESPSLYAAMVRNGLERIEHFSADQVARQWRDLLAGPVAAGYWRWLSAPAFQRHWVRPAVYPLQALAFRGARELHRYRINHGPRLLTAGEEVFGPELPSGGRPH